MMCRKYRRFLLALVCFLLLSSGLFSQSASGTVTITIAELEAISTALEKAAISITTLETELAELKILQVKQSELLTRLEISLTQSRNELSRMTKSRDILIGVAITGTVLGFVGGCFAFR